VFCRRAQPAALPLVTDTVAFHHRFRCGRHPPLLATSNIHRALNLPVDIRNVFVLLAPGFRALTAWATYKYVGSYITLAPFGC
jgi:hypothetical protein